MKSVKELQLHYSRMPENRQRRHDRIQLLIASLSFITGYMDSLQDYPGWLLLIPMVSFIIALMNILIVVRYSWFERKYGPNLESTVFRINGIMMLVTALSFELIGRHRVQYAYYVLAIIYFFILPHIAINARKKMYITFSVNMILIRSLRRSIELRWPDIEIINLTNGLLKIKSKKRRRVRKYYLQTNDPAPLSALEMLLKVRQKEYGFSFKER